MKSLACSRCYREFYTKSSFTTVCGLCRSAEIRESWRRRAGIEVCGHGFPCFSDACVQPEMDPA